MTLIFSSCYCFQSLPDQLKMNLVPTMSPKYRNQVCLLKSNIWVQWQTAFVLRGFALRLLCNLSALRMCRNEINLPHLNLGLVLHYGRSTLRLSDFLLFLSLTLQHVIHHAALQPSGRMLFTRRRSLGSTSRCGARRSQSSPAVMLCLQRALCPHQKGGFQVFPNAFAF